MTLRTRGSQRGVAVVWFAFVMMLFLAFIAIGIDMAKLAAAKTQLQNAADAAALAAVSAVDPATGAITHDIAVARAEETALQNKAFINDPQPVVIDAGDVAFLSGNRVQVTTRRTGATSVVAQMANVLGFPRLNVTAVAVAKADTAGSVDCITPLGIVPHQNFVPGCGNVYTLRASPGTGSQGNYGYLSLVACPESPAPGPPQNPGHIAWLIENGWCCGMKVGDEVNTAGGIKGPASAGIQDRFFADTDQRLNICASQYRGNGSRMVTVPILNDFGSGTSTPAIVRGFATFFLRNIPDKKIEDISAEYVYMTAVGGGGGGNANGLVTYALRLVR
jgi:hypothetical protein